MATKEKNKAADITDKRERIIEAASDLIIENGIQLTAMADIAEKAHVANGTLYLYFDSKQALTYAVYQRLVEDITGIVLADYSVEAPVQERFFRHWSVFLEHLLQHPKRAQLLLYLNTTPYIDIGFKAKVSGKLLHAQLEILREGKKRQLLTDMDTITAVWFIYGSLLFLVNRADCIRNLLGNKKAINQVVQGWWNGIAIANSGAV